MKKVSFLLSLLFATVILFAQDSTSVTIPVGGGVMDWIQTHLGTVALIVLGLYELGARLFPTIQNISILSKIIAIINSIFPNRKAIANSSTVVKHID